MTPLLPFTSKRVPDLAFLLKFVAASMLSNCSGGVGPGVAPGVAPVGLGDGLGLAVEVAGLGTVYLGVLSSMFCPLFSAVAAALNCGGVRHPIRVARSIESAVSSSVLFLTVFNPSMTACRSSGVFGLEKILLTS